MNNHQAVTVLIPTYNGLPLLKKYLSSVFEMMKNGDQLIIADDASTDQTFEWLKHELNGYSSTESKEGQIVTGTKIFAKKTIDCLFFQARKNQRFAGIVNLSMSYAKYHYVFLLNNDVIPEKNCRDILLSDFSDPLVFAVGCLEYEDSKKGKKAGKNKLWFERGMYHHAKADNFLSGPTAWASGGSAMFDYAKWKELGGFDLSFYPAYWEDLDLSFRAKEEGWKVLFNEEAVVIHKHETTNSSVFKAKGIFRMSWKNLCLFTWKHATIKQRLLFLLWQPYWLAKIWKNYV